tara:strand:+ start:360 stop:1025 length:666 start_codon:yes stop_codon:yes gene_type:complete
MKHLNIDESLHEYIVDKSVNEHPAQKALREYTMTMPTARMQISPVQGQFMWFLVKLTHAKKILELGTFTGYSALTMSLALPKDGQLITCDINHDWTEIASKYWKQANISEKITLKLGPAIDSLNQLLNEGHQQSFDMIFIDADKSNYIEYYKLALELIHPNGIILIDNVLWDGKVVDESETGKQTRTIRQLNDMVGRDARVESALVPIADGILMIKPKAIS